jgi:hypothetical protein
MFSRVGVTAVTVESRARAQLYIWGKTQEDLDKFFATLHTLILTAQGLARPRSTGPVS